MLFKHALRQQLEKVYPDRELARWFDPLDVRMDESGLVLRISFPHAYFGRWFMESVKTRFEREVFGVINNATIVYDGPEAVGPGTVGPGAVSAPLPPPGLPQGEAANERPGTQAAPDLPPGDSLPGDLRAATGASGKAAWARGAGAGLPLAPEHSFATFLANRKNDLPLAAARECVQGAASSCAPFVLYGQGGVGKSHLLGAMAWACEGCGKLYFYGSIEFLENIDLSSGNYSHIREQAIFLDDIQRIAAFPHLQDALIALIDSLRAAKKLLALSCDAHPSRCPGLSPKLRSRLNSGLVMEVKRPDLDIRTRYVQRKNKDWALDLGKETVLAIAGRYADMRGIDGFLAKLRFSRTLSESADPMELLERDTDPDSLSAALIIQRTAAYFGLSPEELVGKSRERRLIQPRHAAMLLCRELLGLSLVRIGQTFGGRNHSSVHNSIKQITKLRDSDKDTNSAVQELKQLCLNQP